MKLIKSFGAAAALAAFAASGALAQVTVSGDGTELAGLKACIAAAEEGDQRAIDICVADHVDEITAFLAAHPKTSAATDEVSVQVDMSSEDTSEDTE
ncbi:MAG: hypothetical protein RLN72_09680 [Henriciella sp.]